MEDILLILAGCVCFYGFCLLVRFLDKLSSIPSASPANAEPESSSPS